MQSNKNCFIIWSTQHGHCLEKCVSLNVAGSYEYNGIEIVHDYDI